MDVFLNGELLNDQNAEISAQDAGFQHAVGLFETLAVYGGEVFRLSAHMDRMAESARELGMLRDPDPEAWANAVTRAVRSNGVDRARVRITVTPGAISLLRGDDDGEPRPTVFVQVTDPVTYDPQFFSDGIMVRIGPPAANPFDPMAGHKTLNYWPRLRSLREAASLGAGEVIWLNVTNHLASGAVSNLFLVKDGELKTPYARGEEPDGAIGAPVRPGITRATVIELAEANDQTVIRTMLSVTDLLEADEVFLTNSSWQILPVSAVEKSTIGDGTAGPITTDLRERLLKLIAEETDSGAD
ncbi:MAG: aminotransferase class IV [Phycisphaeraceae bacterium]|nr:aminotransferase class IV [Phycisphaeraceae bacterium]